MIKSRNLFNKNQTTYSKIWPNINGIDRTKITIDKPKIKIFLLNLGIFLSKVNRVNNPKTIISIEVPAPKATSMIGNNSLSFLSNWEIRSVEEPSPLKNPKNTANKKTYFFLILSLLFTDKTLNIAREKTVKGIKNLMISIFGIIVP